METIGVHHATTCITSQPGAIWHMPSGPKAYPTLPQSGWTASSGGTILGTPQVKQPSGLPAALYLQLLRGKAGRRWRQIRYFLIAHRASTPYSQCSSDPALTRRQLLHLAYLSLPVLWLSSTRPSPHPSSTHNTADRPRLLLSHPWQAPSL